MTPTPVNTRLAFESDPKPKHAITRSRIKAAAALAAGYALESVYVEGGSPVFRFAPGATEFFDRVHEHLRDIEVHADRARQQGPR